MDSTAKGPVQTHRRPSKPSGYYSTTTCACCLGKSNTPSANRPTRGSGTRSTSFSEVEESQESRRHWDVLRCDAIHAPASRRNGDEGRGGILELNQQIYDSWRAPVTTRLSGWTSPGPHGRRHPMWKADELATLTTLRCLGHSRGRAGGPVAQEDPVMHDYVMMRLSGRATTSAPWPPNSRPSKRWRRTQAAVEGT